MKCEICLKNFSGWQYAFRDVRDGKREFFLSLYARDGKREFFIICDDCVKKEILKTKKN